MYSLESVERTWIVISFINICVVIFTIFKAEQYREAGDLTLSRGVLYWAGVNWLSAVLNHSLGQ